MRVEKQQELNDLVLKLSKVDYYTWLLKFGYLPNKDKYSFENYEYLKDIAKSTWKPGYQKYLRKSAQSGGSELAISWMLWLCERGLKDLRGVGYLFPAMEQLNDHVKARVMPILEIDRFHANLKEVNLRFIRYNNIPLYFRSGHKRAMKGWPAGAVVIDEFDEFEDPVSIIPTVEARLNASYYKWIFGLSTPTVPDVGIDKVFSFSSQYNWYIPCQKCGKRFAPLNEVIISGFDNCVVRDNNEQARFVCPNCKELTETNILGGAWQLDVDRGPQRICYSISRLFLRNSNLTELLDKYEEALNIQEFYNSDLGLPYAAPNARLKRQNITDCCLGDVEHWAFSEGVTWAGIDVGKKCHWIIGEPKEDYKSVVAYGHCNFDDIPRLLELYNTKYLVIDLRPYEQEVKKIVRLKKGYYANDFNSGNQEDWYRIIKSDEETIDKAIRIIKTDRTQSCDNLIEQITKKRYIFPGKTKGDNDFITQMCAPMRMDKTNKDTGEVKAYYKSAAKKDHYFFAMAFLNLAFNLKKSSFAKIGGLFF